MINNAVTARPTVLSWRLHTRPPVLAARAIWYTYSGRLECAPELPWAAVLDCGGGVAYWRQKEYMTEW